MTPEQFYATVLIPALNKTEKFAPEIPRNRNVEVLMVAISGTEANWTERLQDPSQMAHGLFQMQLNDIRDIQTNPAGAKFFDLMVEAFGIQTQTAEHLFELIETPSGDVLAAVLARLNLWCDPNPIPPADEEATLFAYYCSTWRPGKPNPKRFAVCYGQSLSAVPA